MDGGGSAVKLRFAGLPRMAHQKAQEGRLRDGKVLFHLWELGEISLPEHIFDRCGVWLRGCGKDVQGKVPGYYAELSEL